MNQDEAPLLDALAEYHREGRYGFTPPGHRQGRGAELEPEPCWATVRFDLTC
jgi:arginine/lysine/ornithine decarboxylase